MSTLINKTIINNSNRTFINYSNRMLINNNKDNNN